MKTYYSIEELRKYIPSLKEPHKHVDGFWEFTDEYFRHEGWDEAINKVNEILDRLDIGKERKNDK